MDEPLSKRLGVLIGIGSAVFGGLITLVTTQSASVGTATVTAQKLGDLHDAYKSMQNEIVAISRMDGITRVEMTNRLTALEVQLQNLDKSLLKLTIAVETKK